MMSSSSSSSSSQPPPRLRRCCRCNGTAKCLRCLCVRSGAPCLHCLPGENENCHNSLALAAPSSVVPPSSSGLSGQLFQDFTPSASSYTGPELPSLSVILQASVPTFQHIPKGARDYWARVLGDCLSLVVDDPADIVHPSMYFQNFHYSINLK